MGNAFSRRRNNGIHTKRQLPPVSPSSSRSDTQDYAGGYSKRSGPPSARSDPGSPASSGLGGTSPPDPLLRYFAPYQPPDTTVGTKLSMQQHYLVRGLCKVVFAGIPRLNLDAGAKVLEAGGSTGIWLAEMERDFPNGQYWMVDLPVNMWPDTQFINNSKRLKIVESSSLSQLPFLDNCFDYVHEQAQLFITPESSWPPVISELTRVIKPGGYIDLVELDPHPSTFPTPLVANFLNVHLGKMRAGGFFLRGASRVEELLDATGQFTDVQVVRYTAPIGWDGQHGALWRMHMKEGYTNHRMIMGPSITSDEHMPSEEEYDAFLEQFFDDCAAAHCFANVFRISARKR
ncbi:S-adenosyl-L-methionine-dependent methyltransferase [Cladochytrium replicatum]|nr:S-adenosyl-L-methionine-dependent methyltransferase [Cladochytrium replicatum]